MATATQAARASSPPAAATTPSTDDRTWLPGGASACGPAAYYRLGGVVGLLGNCAGMMFDPPATLTLAVGQRLDIAMMVELDTGRPDLRPPTSQDEAIVKIVSTGTAGATFVATAPGRTLLISSRFCLHVASGNETTGPCPLVALVVGP
jgi:hypothetical protein